MPYVDGERDCGSCGAENTVKYSNDVGNQDYAEWCSLCGQSLSEKFNFETRHADTKATEGRGTYLIAKTPDEKEWDQGSLPTDPAERDAKIAELHTITDADHVSYTKREGNGRWIRVIIRGEPPAYTQLTTATCATARASWQDKPHRDTEAEKIDMLIHSLSKPPLPF